MITTARSLPEYLANSVSRRSLHRLIIFPFDFSDRLLLHRITNQWKSKSRNRSLPLRETPGITLYTSHRKSHKKRLPLKATRLQGQLYQIPSDISKFLSLHRNGHSPENFIDVFCERGLYKARLYRYLGYS